MGWLIKAILLCESSAEKCQGAAEVSAPARVIASGCISSGKHVNRIVISEKTLWYGIFHSWRKQSTSAATLVPIDASLIYKSREGRRQLASQVPFLTGYGPVESRVPLVQIGHLGLLAVEFASFSDPSRSPGHLLPVVTYVVRST